MGNLGPSITLANVGGPTGFVSIAAGTPEDERFQSVVYAVSGGDAVYRFSNDLEPDAELAPAANEAPLER
jgi:hypothetical protein